MSLIAFAQRVSAGPVFGASRSKCLRRQRFCRDRGCALIGRRPPQVPVLNSHVLAFQMSTRPLFEGLGIFSASFPDRALASRHRLELGLGIFLFQICVIQGAVQDCATLQFLALAAAVVRCGASVCSAALWICLCKRTTTHSVHS